MNYYLHANETRTDREVLTELITRRNDYEDLFRKVLQEGLADGTLSVPDVAIAGRAILGALNSLVDWYRIRPEQSRSEQMRIADTLATTIVRGLLA